MTEPRSPIVCSLTAAELPARRAEIRDALRSATVEARTELADGYAVRFTAAAGLLPRLATLVELESECCPFLTFAIEVAEQHGPISLRITGPCGTKDLVRAMLDEG